MVTLRRSMIAASTAVLLGAILLGYAYFIEPRRLVVNQYELNVKGWDRAFDGFRVALISDIHAGSNGIDEAKLREIVEKTNEQGVDAVFMLGDYVSRRPDDHSRLRMEPDVIVQNLSGINARYGVFVVLGNHDEAYAADALIAAFERSSYNILNGKLAQINIAEGKRIRILGLKDHTNIGVWKDFSDDAKKLTGPTEGTGDLIVLEHGPDTLPSITGDLLISRDLKVIFFGHTHGGQIWLPIIGAPVVPSFFGQKYARGLVTEAGIDIFTTSGIGTSILPFRFMVTPEIAIVTIRSSVE